MNDLRLIPVRLGRNVCVHLRRDGSEWLGCGRRDDVMLTVTPHPGLVSCGSCKLQIERGLA